MQGEREEPSLRGGHFFVSSRGTKREHPRAWCSHTAKKEVQPYFWCSHIYQLASLLGSNAWPLCWYGIHCCSHYLGVEYLFTPGILGVFFYIYFFRLPTIGGGEPPVYFL